MTARVRIGLLLAVAALAAWPGVAAAADPPDPGRTQSFEFDSGGTTFPYIVYTPTSYDRSHPAPLLVMAHGCQTTAEEQMRANLYNQLAEREGFVVMYPDIDESGTKQPGPLRNCWRFFSEGSWHRDMGDAAALAGMTRTVMKDWRIDPERTYLVGMSAGGFMTSIMSAAYPDLYAAVGINAAGAYADPGCLGGNPVTTPVATSAQLARDEMGSRARIVPRLVMGGDSDQGITPPCADKAFEQGLRTNNLVLGDKQDGPIALTPASVREDTPPGRYSSTVSTYRDPAGCIIGQRWLIHGMNHFWPGGSTDQKWASFTDPKGPNGAEISWAFLSRYTKSTTAMPCAEAPASTPVAPRCKARWLRPAFEARSMRATVNGRRVTARVVRGRPLVRLPGGRRARTVVAMSGRKASGRPFATRRVFKGCGPG